MSIEIRAHGAEVAVIGHRGACGHAPENTMPAFHCGRKLGAIWVEADVKKTADGQFVLMHDQTVDRTTDGTGRVAELSFEEIRGLDAGAWFGAEYADTGVPLLEELLSWASSADIGVCLDLGMGFAHQDLSALGRLVTDHGLAKETLAICWKMGPLCALRESCPEISIGILYRENPERVLREAREAHLDFLHPYRYLVSPELIEEAHDAGLPVAASVDSDEPFIAKRLRWGLDVTNCDHPDLPHRVRN
jgi:glycerophosphoryl diester phosphodiesterase